MFGRFEGNGLVVSDGELWSRHRRVVQPAFRASQLESYAIVIATCVDELLDGWKGETVVDLSDEMRRLTLRIVTERLCFISREKGEDLRKYPEQVCRSREHRS